MKTAKKLMVFLGRVELELDELCDERPEYAERLDRYATAISEMKEEIKKELKLINGVK